jgi:transcriptional regulator with XRE-family HTH domain
VGKNLRIWRKYNNLTQEEVGSKIGCSQQAYQKYEKGTRSLPIDHLAKLSRLFNVSMEQLVFPQRGLRDIPRYKPHAKISKHIHVVEVLYYNGEETVTRGEFAPITYKKLYDILDGRNRSHSPIGYATAANGDMVLLITCADFPYDSDTFDDKDDRMTIERLKEMDAEEQARYTEEFLECKTDAMIDDELQISSLSSTCTLYDPDSGSRQQIKYVADDLSIAKAELSHLNSQTFQEIVRDRRD